MIKNEMVNHPQHYKNNTYECIDVMLDIFDKDKTLAFCELNAFKYLCSKEGEFKRLSFPVYVF